MFQTTKSSGLKFKYPKERFCAEGEAQEDILKIFIYTLKFLTKYQKTSCQALAMSREKQLYEKMFNILSKTEKSEYFKIFPNI